MADSGNDRVQKFDANGAWLAAWGERGGGDGQLREPRGLVAGGDGRVYVADSGNNRIVIFSPMTYILPIATIAHVSGVQLVGGDILTAEGRGQDSDETPAIAAYRWQIDGADVGSSAKLTRAATAIGPGDHTLSFAVQDSEGQWSAPVSMPISVAAPAQAGWTMLLYLAGDYPDGGRLRNAFERTLARLRASFRNPDVRIAVQIDGPADGDTRRLLIAPGGPSEAPEVTEIAYGERAMDDPATLADFIHWGQSSFPAAHYYLAIADHGQAISGIAWDGVSDPGGAYLTVRELGQALSATGVAPIDILHLDASSMNLPRSRSTPTT